MNKNFYDDFEDTTLRAYKLDDLKQEDFKVLKKIGIRRMGQQQLQNALLESSDSDNEEINPYKQVRNQKEVVKELIRTKSKDFPLFSL